MIKAIINGILSFIKIVVQTALAPANQILNTLFPNLASAVSSFTTFVNTYIGGSLSYFFSMFPPIFRAILVIFFTFTISYYTIYYTYVGIKKIFVIIKNIKIW